MHAEIVMSGSGGQGVLLIGRILAEAGVLEGRKVACLPSYGAEKRGGTVSCSVTISDEQIGAICITRPGAAIAMNQTSAIRLRDAVKPGGLLIVNQSLVSLKAGRDNIRIINVPANSLAAEMGNDSAANMIILGALIANYPAAAISSIKRVMKTMFARNLKVLDANRKAFQKGLSLKLKASKKRDKELQKLPGPLAIDFASR